MCRSCASVEREVVLMNALLLASLLSSVQPVIHVHETHRDQLGSISFPTSCSVTAQPKFLRGVAWLHSFEYEQAEASFKEAAAVDPACSIAQWGVAMSLYHPLWAPPSAAELERGRDAVE